MLTSQTSFLSKPAGDERIPEPTLAYIRARSRQKSYDLIVRELKNSGISQATLARRLRKGTDQISRLLRRPGNWELDTLSEALFAVTGGSLTCDVSYPARKSELFVDRTGSTVSNLLEMRQLKINNQDIKPLACNLAA